MRSESIYKFLTLLLFATSCGGREIAGTDGNTHWLECEDDSDCSNHTCVDGYCRPDGDVSSHEPDTTGGSTLPVNTVAPDDTDAPDDSAPSDNEVPHEYASNIPGELGAACIPGDEYSPTFSGFSLKSVYLAFTEQCESNVCLVNHFQGRVTCPNGQRPDFGGECFTPDGETLVGVDVDPQLVYRRPQNAVYCSCRCDGPDPTADYCNCGEGFECKDVTAPNMAGYDGQDGGSYCVVSGTDTPVNVLSRENCAGGAEECGDAQDYTPAALGISADADQQLESTTEMLKDMLIRDSDVGCVPRNLPVTNDELGSPQAACRLFEAVPPELEQPCELLGHKSVSNDESAAVIEELQVGRYCTNCADYTVCEIEQLNASNGGESCLNDEEATGDGWCYINPEAGLGSEALLPLCPATAQRRLRYVGEAATFDSLTFIYCMGSH